MAALVLVSLRPCYEGQLGLVLFRRRGCELPHWALPKKISQALAWLLLLSVRECICDLMRVVNVPPSSKSQQR